MKKLYKFAGIEVEVSASDEVMYEEEHILEEFQIANVTTDYHHFVFDKVEQLDAPKGKLSVAFPSYCVYEDGQNQIRYIGSVTNGWQNAHMMAIHNDKDHYIQIKNEIYKDRMGINTLLNAMAAEHLVLNANGVIFHTSFIEHNGKAILFTAPSGTGKSTQAELWKKHRNADIINGDRAVIRLVDGKPFACGIPFAGSSKYCKNAMLPIEAIVYLKQSSSTTIKRLNPLSSFRQIWEECTINTWNNEDVEKATNILIDIISQVPIFELACTPDESAIIALENELKLI